MERLVPNNTYHIFNHANGKENIFSSDDNYGFFLEKYLKFISPIAETYAYCLLPNHFHLVVRIRRREVIEEAYTFSKVQNFGKGESPTDEQLEKFISKQFANFFSCYTQSYNKYYDRRGSLFLKNFKRELISTKNYFLSAVIYIHRNPVHHGFCSIFQEWGYASFHEIIEEKSFIVEGEKLLKIFGGKDNFIELHQAALNKFRESIVSDL